METKINSQEENSMPYLIKSILDKGIIKDFSSRKIHKRRIHPTEKEMIQEVEDFYDKYFPNN